MSPDAGSARAASQAAIDQYANLVRHHAARVFRQLGGRVPFDDLLSYGQLGLLDALARYEANKGVAFATFAYHRIRGAILDGAERMGALRERARLEMREVGGPAMNLNSGIGPRVVGKIKSATHQRTVVDVELSEMANLEDRNAPAPDRRLLDVEMRAAVRRAVRGLDASGRQVVEMVYFDGLRLQDAARVLGLSKSWVSRVHAKALLCMAASLKLDGLAEA